MTPCHCLFAIGKPWKRISADYRRIHQMLRDELRPLPDKAERHRTDSERFRLTAEIRN